jgi:MFS family permease
LLIVTTVVAHIALVGARITTSLYAISLHASEFTIGILIALFALFPMIFAVPMGRWIDRIGLRRPMRVGAAMMISGCLVPSMFGGLTVLYFSVLLIGSGFLAIHIAVQHAVGALAAVNGRAKSFSWLALGYSTSSFIGPIVAGYMIDHTSHRWSYTLFTCFALAALFMMTRRDLRAIRLPEHPPEVLAAARGSIVDLLREPELRRVYLVSICMASAWDLFMFVMPIYCSKMAMSASSIGWILGTFSAATFAVRLAMHWLSRHFSEWQILTSALIVAVLCYLMFPFLSTPFAILLLAFVLGLALGAGQPNVLALLHDNSPAGRAGEAVGVRVTIGNASQVALPLAFGALGATLGLFPVFWAMGALIGIGVPLAWRRAAAKQT